MLDTGSSPVRRCGVIAPAMRRGMYVLSRQPTIHTKTPRAKHNSPTAWGMCWSGKNNPDLWGAGEWPVVLWSMWLGAVSRAPPVRDTCAFRAHMGLLPAIRSTQSRTVSSRSAEPPTEPAHSRSAPGLNTVQPDQALSGPASFDAAGAGADQQVSGSGFFAGVFPIAEFLARRYGARTPELTASRRPRLRQPRPSAWNGRSDECGTGAKGVEKMVGFFGWGECLLRRK